MSEQIKVEDGLKIYDIVNQDGKLLGQLTFNPSDTNILERYSDVMKQLSLMKEDFGKIMRGKNASEELAQLDKIVYEKIDYLLNAEVSKPLFSIMGPFSPLANGQFFIENVMDAIGKVIKVDAEKQSKKVNAKIKKYTEKYHN